MLFISFFDFRLFRNFSYPIIFLYVMVLILLLAVLFFGKEVRGSSSWFSFRGFSFEPVEFAKIVVIIVLAKYFSLRHIEMFRIRHVAISAIYVGIPAILVLRQPDLGSTLILLAIWIGMVIIAGIKLRHLLLVILIGALVCAGSWSFFLKDYQKNRILDFINPQRDPLGSGYNIRQSLIAVGSGGILGKGLGYGSQSQLNFLPERHSDFIFAAFAEEWGFLGALFLILLFGVLFYRLMKINFNIKDNFSRLFIAGISIMLLFQIVINIGMNIDLLPITGIPLPFISYGGSNLLMNFLALGIIQGIRIGSLLRRY